MTDQAEDDKQFQDDGFAHTSWVIPERPYDFQAHQWEQEGNRIKCTSCRPAHASFIPVDKMLVKVEGKYDIVPVTQLS